MKIAIVKASEIGKANRMDAGFHVLATQYGSRVAELQRQMSSEEAIKLLKGLTPAQRQALMPLGRNRRGSKPQVRDIIREYPHLSLAIVEDNPKDIIADIDRQIAELEAKLQILHLRRSEETAKGTVAATDEIDHSSIGMQPGFRYPLRDPDRYDDEFGFGYGFALIPEDGLAGAIIHDAWIVNENNEAHPGLNACPTPVSESALDLTRAVKAQAPDPVPNPSGWNFRSH